MQAKRLPTVDALRGIAILSVVSSHVFWLFADVSWFPKGPGNFILTPMILLSRGALGVQLFFLLSGFVLALPYVQGRRKFTTWRDWRAFYCRRSLRLLPLYTLAWVVPLFGLYLKDPFPSHVLSVATLLTMTSSFFPATFLPRYNIVLWSLGVEFWLSVVFPLCVMALLRFGPSRTFFGALFLATGSRLAAVLLLGVVGTNVMMSSFVSQLDAFVVGMLLAQRCHSGSRTRWPLFHACAGIACLWFASSIIESVSQQLLPWETIAFGFLLFTCGWGLCVDAALSAGAFCSRLWYPIRQLGRMCYSLYVWHVPLILLCMSWGYFTDAWLFSTYLGLLLTVAMLSYRYIEFGHVDDPRPLFGLPAKRMQTTPPPVSGQAALA